jgi:hypothetical protein
MTKDFPNLGERRAAIKHTNRQRMAELMRTHVGRVNLGSPKGVAHYRPGVRASHKTADWRYGAQE